MSKFDRAEATVAPVRFFFGGARDVDILNVDMEDSKYNAVLRKNSTPLDLTLCRGYWLAAASSPCIPHIAGRIYPSFPERAPGSVIARCFGRDEALGFGLPVARQLLHLAVVVDGTAHELRLLGREPATYELAALHVPPFVIRSVARRGILGAAAAGFAASAQVLVERCAPQKLDSARPELVTRLLAGCGIIAA